MKYGSLLIGFEYIRSNSAENTHENLWKPLPGIPVDLYQAYSHSKTISKNILVFTDINKDYHTSILKRAILEGYVDSNLLSFIEDIKEKKHHQLYNSKKINGYDMNNFDTVISKFVQNIDRLFIYYTGHGKNGNMILPDYTQVSLDYLKDLISKYSNKKCECVIILDCCESNGMSLPYQYKKLDQDNNTNIDKKPLKGFKLVHKNFIHQHILCLSSSQLTENSSATRSGSIFTRIFFDYMNKNKNKPIRLDNLMEYLYINNEGTTIYYSYTNLNLLWSWFCKNQHHNLSIEMDHNNSIITVTINGSQKTIEDSSSMRDYLRYYQQGRYDSIY